MPVPYCESKLLLGSYIQYVPKIFQKFNISYPLIRALKCAYQGVRNGVSGGKKY